MGFEQLIEKVSQAEQVLEAKERSMASDWQQLKRSWREAWTPGRIVVAGLASGYLVGRAEPLSKARGGSVLNMMSAVGALFAGSGAQAAAGEADQAKAMAEATAQVAGADAAVIAASGGKPPEPARHLHSAHVINEQERLRRAGLL